MKRLSKFHCSTWQEGTWEYSTVAAVRMLLKTEVILSSVGFFPHWVLLLIWRELTGICLFWSHADVEHPSVVSSELLPKLTASAYLLASCTPISLTDTATTFGIFNLLSEWKSWLCQTVNGLQQTWQCICLVIDKLKQNKLLTSSEARCIYSTPKAEWLRKPWLSFRDHFAYIIISTSHLLCDV